MIIFATDGIGSIDSHTVISLFQSGSDVVILDNLHSLSAKILPRLQQILDEFVSFYENDIRDHGILWRIFAEHDIGPIVHFAGLRAVSKSVAEPMEYYDNDVSGSLVLAEEMTRAGVFDIVFNSSATVYGDPGKVPYAEDTRPGDTTDPYGISKAMVERILTDIRKADPRWGVTLLRYLSSIDAYQNDLAGEHPSGIPNNLLSYVCQVASGELPYLSVLGDDYPIPGDTGIRDYICMVDLAGSHATAMKTKSHVPGVRLLNSGSGWTYSVLEAVRAFEAVSGLTIPYQIKPCREGDSVCVYAGPVYIKQ